MKRKFGLITLWIALLVISACGQDNNKNTPPVESPPAVVESTPEPTPALYEHYALLSGHGMLEPNQARPVAVLINNLAPARPQSGLTEADVIWEVLAEGGITRLVAIFQSASEADFDIGPVRSNRPYFIRLADTYGAIIAHAGASNDAYAILQRQNKPYLDEIKNAGAYYWRSSERKAPHNLYTNLGKLREGASKKGYAEEAAIQGYRFMSEMEAEEIPVGSIKQLEVQFQLKNYRVGYQFDENERVYLRSINDEPHIDKNNEKQLFASNLIFMQTAHQVLDSEGRLSVNLESGGDALVIQNGLAVEGSWILAQDGMIRFMKDGTEIKLLPGKSIIHILPEGKAITEHAVWE